MKTHCKRGHAMTPDNVRIRIQRAGYEQRNCRKCETINQKTRDRNGAGRTEAFYEPLDEILASPTVRVLRVMRRHDWITCETLLDVLEIEDIKGRNNISGTLQHLARQGDVAQDKSSFPRLYRIAKAGIYKLNKAHERYLRGLDAVELTDEELQEAA